ncbi:MAG: 3-oxoacyl-ACP reductase FabG [Actinomycetota bacterium]
MDGTDRPVSRGSGGSRSERDRASVSPPKNRLSKVAVVTGGSRGIGRACAEALAAAGWKVAVGFRTSDIDAKETLEAIEGTGGVGATVRLDTLDETSVTDAFKQVADTLGPVTGLVNNAGYSKDGLLITYPIEELERTLDTNVRGAFLCTRAALRGMLRARWGRIVNVSSAVALHGNPGQTAYAASKSALVGITKSLAREVGAKGITVNAVCPGLLDTDMTSHLTDQARSYYLDQTPLGRAATLAEVANVVRFLMSEEASYVNGAVVPIDGGLTA